MAAATTSRRLCFILSMMCLASFVNSMGVKEQLAHMRKELVELQEKIKTNMAEFKAQREFTEEVIAGNIARANCLKKSPRRSDPEVQEVIQMTERNSAHTRRVFERADEEMMHRSLQVQQYIDFIKNLEALQDASYAFAM